MKKIINNPIDFVDETLDGLIKSHPKVYSLASDNSRVITRAIKSINKVFIAFYRWMNNRTIPRTKSGV